MPVLLGHSVCFPNPEQADAEGLVAIGGELTEEWLLAAYRRGLFPWTANPITWWSPDPRAIIELDQFHVPESLAKTIRRRPFEITFDRAFREVMQACAAPAPHRESTWITEEFIAAYTRLYQQGHAHSVECWSGGELVGGVYGVSIGALFAGESMFHRAANASKVALYHLVQHLRQKRFSLFDIQTVSPVTRSLGAREIPRREFLDRLGIAVSQECKSYKVPSVERDEDTSGPLIGHASFPSPQPSPFGRGSHAPRSASIPATGLVTDALDSNRGDKTVSFSPGEKAMMRGKAAMNDEAAYCFVSAR